MIRVIVAMAMLLLSARSEYAGPTVVTVVTLKKEQLAALSAAIHEMQRIKRSYNGQQVVIQDKGEVFYVSFFDDPINIAVAGDQNGIGWVVRKNDHKVLRPFPLR